MLVDLQFSSTVPVLISIYSCLPLFPLECFPLHSELRYQSVATLLGHSPIERLSLVQHYFATAIERSRHRLRPPHIRYNSQCEKHRLKTCFSATSTTKTYGELPMCRMQQFGLHSTPRRICRVVRNDTNFDTAAVHIGYVSMRLPRSLQLQISGTIFVTASGPQCWRIATLIIMVCGQSVKIQDYVLALSCSS